MKTNRGEIKQQKPSISQDFKHLEEIITQLSGEQEDLENSISLFKEGVAIVKRLKEQLKKVKLEIEEISEELELESSEKI